MRLALFDFEMEELSANVLPPSGTDAADLARVTSEVRQLLEQSGRYRLVDVSSADAEAARAHKLRWCDGCEATIARQLGAAQSFVGVVKRVSRMEYTVKFRVRDAATGAVLSDAETPLRMGASYSWSRGAERLVKEWLAKPEGQP